MNRFADWFSPNLARSGKRDAIAAGFKWRTSTTLILLGGLLFQGALVVYFFTHLQDAVLRLMPDDAFYYLKIAQNISQGLGSVFSVGEPTNGYHPLWMLTLVAVQSLLRPSAEYLILLALSLAVVFNLVAALVLKQLLAAFGFSELQSRVGISIYLFSPWTVYLTLTGLETPLFYACLFIFLLIVQRSISTPGLSIRQSLELGLSAGLVMLARTDAVFFVLFAFGLIFIRGKKDALKPLLCSGLVAAFVLSPWLAWNLLLFGTIEQSSSVAISLLNHSLVPSIFSRQYWAFALDSFINVSYWGVWYPLITHARFESKLASWPIALAMGLVILGLLVAYRWLRARDLKWPLVLVIPSLVLVFFYCAVRLFVQVWHLSSLYIVLLTLFLNFVPTRTRFGALYGGLLLLLMITTTVYAARNAYFRPQEWPGRVNYFRHVWPSGSGTIVKQSSQSDAISENMTVCITDSGVAAYFSRHHVVNMDGVVNNRALQYIKAGHFSEYVTLKQCDVLIMDKNRLKFYDRNLAQPAAFSSGD